MNTEIGTIHTIYVRLLDEGEWLGTRAPVTARLEWLHPERPLGLFVLLPEEEITPEDEYEFCRAGTLVICRLVEGQYLAAAGYAPERVTADA